MLEICRHNCWMPNCGFVEHRYIAVHCTHLCEYQVCYIIVYSNVVWRLASHSMFMNLWDTSRSWMFYCFVFVKAPVSHWLLPVSYTIRIVNMVNMKILNLGVLVLAALVTNSNNTTCIRNLYHTMLNSYACNLALHIAHLSWLWHRSYVSYGWYSTAVVLQPVFFARVVADEKCNINSPGRHVVVDTCCLQTIHFKWAGKKVIVPNPNKSQTHQYQSVCVSHPWPSNNQRILC